MTGSIPNRKPADRLADIRAQIAALREEESALREGFIAGVLDREGAEHVVNVVRKENIRLDVPALRKHVNEGVWTPFATNTTTDYVTGTTSPGMTSGVRPFGSTFAGLPV
jgi:hypothetical protein